MTEKCADCGRFIPNVDIESASAEYHFTPDSEFSSEDCWYTCRKCKEFPVGFRPKDIKAEAKAARQQAGYWDEVGR